jgi:hypothetical protein
MSEYDGGSSSYNEDDIERGTAKEKKKKNKSKKKSKGTSQRSRKDKFKQDPEGRSAKPEMSVLDHIGILANPKEKSSSGESGLDITKVLKISEFQ